MAYVQKARLNFFGIDDELKNDASSVYSTVINPSLSPVSAFVLASGATEYESQNTDFKRSPLHNELTRNE